MCGHMDPVYPAPLKLGDDDLPWVVHATHLGHELHQMCNMEYMLSMLPYVEMKAGPAVVMVRVWSAMCMRWRKETMWSVMGRR